MDYLSVGANFAFTIIGSVVGTYFLVRAWLSRKVLDSLSMVIFIAIGLGAIIAAGSRAWVLPFYFGRAVGRPDIQALMLDHPEGLIMLIALSGWSYILHLKPVFSRMSSVQWFMATIGSIAILTALGTVLAQFLATLI